MPRRERLELGSSHPAPRGEIQDSEDRMLSGGRAICRWLLAAAGLRPDIPILRLGLIEIKELNEFPRDRFVGSVELGGRLPAGVRRG